MPEIEPPIPYVYRCYDRSQLTAWISRVPAPAVQRLVPSGVTANQLTVFGSVLMWVAVAGAWWVPNEWREEAALLWVTLLWSYCLLDHVDGIHSRRMGTSSPLGEFLDHALDGWNVGLAVALMALVGGAALQPLVVAVTMAACGLAAVSTWLEQRERGAIYLGQVGPVEGVLVVGLWLASWSLPGARAWWESDFASGFTRADAALLVGALGALGSAGGVWWPLRHARGLRAWLALAAQSGILVMAAAAGTGTGTNWFATSVALGLASAIYCGRVIHSHLAKAPLPWPDFVALPAMAAIALGEVYWGWSQAWAVLPLAWLGVLAWRSWRDTWHRFGHHWHPKRNAVAG